MGRGGIDIDMSQFFGRHTFGEQAEKSDTITLDKNTNYIKTSKTLEQNYLGHRVLNCVLFLAMICCRFFFTLRESTLKSTPWIGEKKQ